MSKNLWAVLGIIIIAVIYEINAKVGVALTLVVLMAMVYTYFSRNIVTWEETR